MTENQDHQPHCVSPHGLKKDEAHVESLIWDHNICKGQVCMPVCARHHCLALARVGLVERLYVPLLPPGMVQLSSLAQCAAQAAVAVLPLELHMCLV